ncbi:hypothetical protein OG824_31800 [Streptomyces prunicolor]|uniref:hypothetical protein n=1 Tax=Streptomyces prunicolor TaxID=67348 RepID=UPI00225A2050|nr:hypothetical protein [Streptomyces prunicolor]MCX5239795.1 hypothetical protein [Streptomyces prunicolor]
MDMKTQAVDDQIAAMLKAGATVQTIAQRLNVGYRRIQRVRTERRIPHAPGRAKRTRAELDVIDAQAVAILREGASHRVICSTLRLSPNHISLLRKEHKIRVPARDQGSS